MKQQQQQTAARDYKSSPSKHHKVYRIILIDDDDTFRSMMLAAGKNYPYILETYTSLADLGSFARLGNYDLAILDFHLPDMDGSEIAEYIEIFFKHTPVILVSADAGKPATALQNNKCIRSFMHKSLGVYALWRSIHEVINLETNLTPPNDPSQPLSFS